MHTPVHSNYGFNDPIPTSTSSPQDVQEQSAGIQAPQYPAPASPTFSSIAERQRMFMADAVAAEQGAQERKDKVLAVGGKAFVGYDKMLRGFMEAKYAKPELKFWDYAQNPSTSAAYRLQGVKKITADVEAGVDIKDIPGMTFGSRQKEGLKGVFGKGTAPELKGKDLIIDTMEKAGVDRIASQAAPEPTTAIDEAIAPVGEGFKARVATGEIAGEAAGEAAKGGLKSTLGKVAGGIGAGLSVASGVERLKSKDQATRIGGGLQVAGGAAGAVALTNFWNPVGWAAAVPAALSIGGSFMGGDRSAIGRTPIGKSLRRLNIS
tara:strand:+ start:204 stop:1166 length:963 start_codon:yes stop_codon:yes gene_type:complete